MFFPSVWRWVADGWWVVIPSAKQARRDHAYVKALTKAAGFLDFCLERATHAVEATEPVPG